MADIKKLSKCRALKPGETLRFGDQTLTNMGDQDTYGCEILEGFTQAEVLDQIERSSWYPQFNQYRKNVIDQCVKDGKMPIQKCKARPYLKEKLLVGTDADPFDSAKKTHVITRYIANLVKFLYPTERNPDGSYKNTFHARNAHYRFLSENIGIPVYDKEKGTWQLTKYKGEEKDWNNLKEALNDARNAGLIPFDQIVDERVLFEMKPPEFKVGKAKNDTYQPNISLEIPLSKDFTIDVDVPQVIFYSEKSELGYVLEALAKKYNIAYFLGRGQMSTSNAHRLYEFIKQHGQKAIVLTLTDYDQSGMNIAQSLARKLQFHRQSDPSEEKPEIVVQQFAISPQDAKDLESRGVQWGVKLYKEGEEKSAKKIYELAALEVFAHDQGISLTEYFEQELLKLLKHDPKCIECSTLISLDQIQQRMSEEHKRLEGKIQQSLNEVLNRMPEKVMVLKQLNIIPNADGSVDVLKYIDQLKEFFEQNASYTALETATQHVQFTPKDIIQKDFGFIDEPSIKKEALVWHEENANYPLATERLNKFKTDTKGIIQYADPEEQKAKEQQRLLDLMESERESDEELKQRILDILDPNDRQESYHTIVTVLNTDSDHPNSNYYVQTGGQFWKVMQDLKHSGQITYLPVQLGNRKMGWYKGKIEVQTLSPSIERPKFASTAERNEWEMQQYGTKERRTKALMKEATRLFQAKNPETEDFWTLQEIGDALGGYGNTAIYNWLREAGIDTKSVRLERK